MKNLFGAAEAAPLQNTAEINFGNLNSQALSLAVIVRVRSLLVPKKGLEPPHPCGYMDLNHARLPIPPLRRGKRTSRYATRYAGKD